MKIVIGITSGFSRENSQYTLKEVYVNAFKDFSVIPILIPATEWNAASEWLSLCHGIVFSGGGDIDPYHWGEAPSKYLGEIEPLRDQLEIQLAICSLRQKVPALGICRGCQVMNVAAGGSILQNIDSRLCHQQKAPYFYGFHQADLKTGSKLQAIMGQSSVRVNSFHHQSVNALGENIIAVAQSEDGIIEAIEHENHPFWIGVQWHPEHMTDSFSFRLMKYFVEAAADFCLSSSPNGNTRNGFNI
ncbi:MAG: gamma-glutamyl-gamma-aminobutyrate hydrolase family protein [Syntrophomonadaceae bacterium]|jgi:putative glutamine amidotransferase|nr:gamma-glutamyl-gamma-aminobutyrate hydrolase family protein [Syntrophomonadaceae bacterium]